MPLTCRLERNRAGFGATDLDYRKKNGQFHSIEQLDEVSGIGPAMMERLRDHVIL
ncbi:ComEA family DNA-binding protein [Mobiluncus mulieris]|uniref:ComEA family DNA-binding protein n=1 Tax=Mobiluncus mulieris TaxID=2052 RepID=UPI0020938AD7|nr:helix-hairpin-helix domain-containing protein [Mobiluncus mulieris]